MADNTFEVEILPDGNVKVTSPGGFHKQHHKQADDFLALLQELLGGEQVEIEKLPRPHLANPQDVTGTQDPKRRQSL